MSTVRRHSVTLKDIAKAAGVSLSTASAALNHEDPRYNAATMQRITDIAKRMGYRPNRSAQFIRSGKNKLIGMIFFGNTLQVTNERAHYVGKSIDERGYELLSLDVHWHGDGLTKVVNRLLETNVGGVILVGPGLNEDQLELIAQRGIPMIGLSTAEHRSIPLVRANMRQGMREATSHLLSLGHRRILSLCLGVPETPLEEWTWVARTQTQGVRDAITALGGGHTAGRAGECMKWLSKTAAKNKVSGFTLCERAEVIYFDPFAYARRAISSISKAKTLPDAIVCQNDEWAVGVIAELATRGIRVPEDIAVIGYNDSALAANFPVPLTSVRQPIPDMAKKAVELCIDAIEHPDTREDSGIFDMPCKLVVRASCRRC